MPLGSKNGVQCRERMMSGKRGRTVAVDVSEAVEDQYGHLFATWFPACPLQLE